MTDPDLIREMAEALDRALSPHTGLHNAMFVASKMRDALAAARERLAREDAGQLVYIPPDSRVGKPPCGECHLRPGETCDICGAREDALPAAAVSAQGVEKLCQCGDRPASECDEEWGPNCDLGNNPAFVRRAPDDVSTQVDAALGIKRKIAQPAPEPAEPVAPRLTVRVQSFPESNGKRNWTALLVRVGPWSGLIGNCGGITVARGELWNRVAYGAECAKLLIGERDTEPDILDYGDDITTPEALRVREQPAGAL